MNLLKNINENVKKIFFIGIGGISMSSLALISKRGGFEVSGSDRAVNIMTERLMNEGIKIYPRHDENNITGADLIVYSAAISADNPEMLKAKELNIQCLKRSKFLGLLMLDYETRIGIAGMHGKSTTTSMISNIYLNSDTEPTIVSGAEMTEINGAYHIGGNENFIFEADEYTDSFHDFYPTAAVVLNIEMDHPDYFKDLSQIIESYKKYINGSRMAILNYDDENVITASEDFDGDRVTYGIENEAVNYRASDIRFNDGFSEFDVLKDGKFLIRLKLSIPGYHNIYNSLASTAAAFENGIDLKTIKIGLENFKGPKRRFEYKRTLESGAKLYDDYAHHPTEIATTLSGVRKLNFNKIRCVYQPHTYSRTYELYDDFLGAFRDADELILVDIYAAREDNLYGITSEKLAEDIKNNGIHAMYMDNFQSAAEYLNKNTESNDILILMGAGDVYKMGEYLK